MKKCSHLERWKTHRNFKVNSQRPKQKFFWAGEVSLNKGTSINISFTTHERKTPYEKISEFFLQDTFKTAFQMRNWTHRWTQSVHFSPPKIRALYFNFQKRAGETSPHPCRWLHPWRLLLIFYKTIYLFTLSNKP